MKLKNPSVGYAISVLRKEEDIYKSLSLKIISTKLPKLERPSNLEEIKLNMSIDFAFQQIISIFTKAEQKRIIAVIDEEEFNKLAQVTLDILISLSNKIQKIIFEEDLEEKERNEQR